MDKFKTMTDEDLIKTLKKYGITHGPVVDTTRTLYEKKLYEFERTKTTIPASSNSYESREQYSRKDYNADNSTIIAQTPANTSQEPVSDRAAETECNNYVVEIQHQKVVVEENQTDVVAGLGASLSKLAAAQERLATTHERLTSSQERLASAQEKQNVLMEGMLSVLQKMLQAQYGLGHASGVGEPDPQAFLSLAPSATEITCDQVHTQGPTRRPPKNPKKKTT